MKHLARLLMLAAVLFATTSSVATAGLLPVNVTVTPENDNFRWTYNIVLPTDSQLRAGDYFTIYDFAGLVATSNVQPNGWSFDTVKVGPVPDGVEPDDDPVLPNLTWRYNGSTLDNGQTGLGNFWAVSLFENPTESFFTARTHRTSDGVVDTNITDTTVPVPSASPNPNLVPEPTSLLLAGLGLPMLGLLRRRKAA